MVPGPGALSPSSPSAASDFRFVHEGAYVVRLKCPMNFDAFPFDTHYCYFEVRAGGKDRDFPYLKKEIEDKM